MNPDLPKVVDALLSERNFQGEIVWQRDQEWLASLVVELVEEKSAHWIEITQGSVSEAEALNDVLTSEELHPAKYIELKNRLESVKPEGE